MPRSGTRRSAAGVVARASLAIAAGALLLLALAAGARAADYSPATGDELQADLSAAALTSDADRILLRPGRYTRTGAGGWTYSGASRLDVIGAGRGATTLSADCSTAIVLSNTGAPISTFGDLTLERAAGAAPAPFFCFQGFSGSGDLHDLSVTSPAGGTNGAGIQLVAGSVERSAIQLRDGAGIEALGPGISIQDVVIRTTGSFDVGVDAFDAGGGADVVANHLTLVHEGAAAPGSFGLIANASSVSGSSIALDDSVLLGYGVSFRTAGGPGATTITPSYSSFDPTATGPGTVATDANRLAPPADPRFVDAASGDYRLRFDSPFVDHGDPLGLGSAESPFDLALGARIVNARRDIGAFEYQRHAPTASATVAPGTVLVGQPAAFTGTGADPDPGEGVSLAWTFDDGGAATTALASHAFSTPGTHIGTLTVTDATGLRAAATATVTVRAATTRPPGPPSRDRTAPRLSLVRLDRTRFRVGSSPTPTAARRAKGTKAGTRFRFTLSEPATVTVALARRARGVVRKGRCVKPPRRRATGKKPRRCTRLLAAGALTRRAGAGASAIAFSGRVGTRALEPASYQATLRARDGAGNRSRASVLAFMVVKR